MTLNCYMDFFPSAVPSAQVLSLTVVSSEGSFSTEQQHSPAPREGVPEVTAHADGKEPCTSSYRTNLIVNKDSGSAAGS